MKLTRKLFGMFLVCLGDLASGALIAHILVRMTEYHDLPILLMDAIGAIIAVAPDLDIPLYKLIISAKPERITEHRDLLHKPLFIIPIFAILYASVSPFWAYLATLCLLAHFIHDSTGSGYGVKWFLPFSQNTYKLCENRIICKWTPKETAKNPWSPTLDWWLEEYYLKLTTEGMAGVILAIIALIIIFTW